jgi:hypothetical protein
MRMMLPLLGGISGSYSTISNMTCVLGMAPRGMERDSARNYPILHRSCAGVLECTCDLIECCPSGHDIVDNGHAPSAYIASDGKCATQIGAAGGRAKTRLLGRLTPALQPARVIVHVAWAPKTARNFVTLIESAAAQAGSGQRDRQYQVWCSKARARDCEPAGHAGREDPRRKCAAAKRKRRALAGPYSKRQQRPRKARD